MGRSLPKNAETKGDFMAPPRVGTNEPKSAEAFEAGVKAGIRAGTDMRSIEVVRSPVSPLDDDEKVGLAYQFPNGPREPRSEAPNPTAQRCAAAMREMGADEERVRAAVYGRAAAFAPTASCGFAAGLSQGINPTDPGRAESLNFSYVPNRYSDYFHFKPNYAEEGSLAGVEGRGILIAPSTGYSALFIKEVESGTDIWVSGGEFFAYESIRRPFGDVIAYGLAPQFGLGDFYLSGVDYDTKAGTITLSVSERRNGLEVSWDESFTGDTGLRAKETFRVEEKFVQHDDGFMRRVVTLVHVKTEHFKEPGVFGD